MQIVDDGELVAIDPIHLQQIAHRFPEGPIGFQIAEITDVLADVDFALDGEGDRTFQIATQSEDRLPSRNRGDAPGV